MKTPALTRFFAIVLACCTLASLRAGELPTIPTETFNPLYLGGDCNYHSLTAASDGYIYFTVCTHQVKEATRMYRYNPADNEISLVADLTDVLGTDVDAEIPQGKIHTPLHEHDGKLYFSSHTAYYTGNLPNMAPEDGRAPYPGGHFMSLDLATGEMKSLAHLQLANEGIITMTLDPANETLYGLTWPTGLLISYDLNEGLLHNWGAVQGRGEWDHLPEDWNFICRRLATDGQGGLWGSTDEGDIWSFQRGEQRPVHYIDGLNVLHTVPVQEANFVWENEPHYFWDNWRTIIWNPQTESFWGLQGGSTQLFEFTPSSNTLRSVRPLRAQGVEQHTRRNPMRTQLGFMLGPNNTLFYLAHAPDTSGLKPTPLGTEVHLITYEIDHDRYTDHGKLVTSDGGRVLFAESIEIGQDGHIYTVAWVETTDPERKKEVMRARNIATTNEHEGVAFEMKLTKLPRWDSFIEK